MKRSEMLSYIVNSLNDARGLIYYADNKEMDDFANNLLEGIEEKGMLPPDIMTGEYYSRENAGYVCRIDNVWEEE